jgi:hypothetical protein
MLVQLHLFGALGEVLPKLLCEVGGELRNGVKSLLFIVDVGFEGEGILFGEFEGIL